MERPATGAVDSTAPVDVSPHGRAHRERRSVVFDFAGEEINLTPSGLGMRLSQFISPNLILGPARAYIADVNLEELGVDIRGLGTSVGGSSVWTRAAVDGPPRTRPTWRRSTLRPNTTRLLVGEKETLPLRALRAAVAPDPRREGIPSTKGTLG